MIFNQLSRLHQQRLKCDRLGLSSWFQLALTARLCRIGIEKRRPGTLAAIKLRDYAFPFYYRRTLSDVAVIAQIFAEEEYSWLSGGEGYSVILDCGANIGCTAVYFLRKYPNARVIAIEPDPTNYAVLKANLAPYGSRALAIRAAVWESDVGLRIERGSYRDGLERSYQVHVCAPGGEVDVEGVGIETLLQRFNIDEVDFLKVDIERSELSLFNTNADRWLGRVRNISIELHDAECEAVFFRALSDYNFDLKRFGELTICRHLLKKHS